MPTTRIRQLTLGLLLGASALFATTTSHAQLLALDFPANSADAGDNGDWTLGYSFRVLTPITVTGLAYWDSASDGLVNTHSVGLWTTGGSLLSSASLPAGTSASLIGEWRYTNVTPITLGLGDYVVAGSHTTGGDVYSYDPPSHTIAPEILFLANSYIEGIGLNFPTDSDSSIGYFGGNFLYRTGGGAVPEPSTYGLLAAFALVGLVAARRLRR